MKVTHFLSGSVFKISVKHAYKQKGLTLIVTECLVVQFSNNIIIKLHNFLPLMINHTANLMFSPYAHIYPSILLTYVDKLENGETLCKIDFKMESAIDL